MRTALLAASKRISDGQLRARLRLGGRSILGAQIDLVRSLGCHRIICLCNQYEDDILSVQHEVEAGGGEFHAVRSNMRLASLVHADDELVVLNDGLIADGDAVAQLAGMAMDDATNGDHHPGHDRDTSETRLSKVIATIPAAHGLCEEFPHDFERIDRDRRWAGFAIIRAAHLQHLADLPPDGDAMSLLLRLALQARVECRSVSNPVLDDGRWTIALDELRVAQREATLIAERRAGLNRAGLGARIAGWGVAWIAPRWLARGSEVSAVLSGAAGLCVCGLGVWALFARGQGASGEWIGVLALGLAALGAFAGEVSRAWGALRGALWATSRTPIRAQTIDNVVDAFCTIALVIACGIYPEPALQITLPLLAIGLARLGGNTKVEKIAGFWRDRGCQMAIFALAEVSGVLNIFLALFTLGALLQLILRDRAR